MMCQRASSLGNWEKVEFNRMAMLVVELWEAWPQIGSSGKNNTQKQP